MIHSWLNLCIQRNLEVCRLTIIILRYSTVWRLSTPNPKHFSRINRTIKPLCFVVKTIQYINVQYFHMGDTGQRCFIPKVKYVFPNYQFYLK